MINACYMKFTHHRMDVNSVRHLQIKRNYKLLAI